MQSIPCNDLEVNWRMSWLMSNNLIAIFSLDIGDGLIHIWKIDSTLKVLYFNICSLTTKELNTNFIYF